jgi:hypothetical protein
VQDLIPESVLAWVKEVKVILNIVELSYEPRGTLRISLCGTWLPIAASHSVAS